jgi:hypothetical protein
MNGPGMWMPTRKDGKNWIVNYTITLAGVVHEQHRKFRVREDAEWFVKDAKRSLSLDERVTHYKFKTSKIEEGHDG